MRFADECGKINHSNSCMIRGLHSQLKWYKECNFALPEFEAAPEHKQGCHLEGCHQRALELTRFLGFICKEQVANSRMNECAKAQTVNSCLKKFEWVPKFFNNTCLEKYLHSLPLEDESRVCGSK